MSFNEADARKFYGILGHFPTEYTELRAHNPKTKEMKKVEFVQGAEAFIKICREWSGQYHVYAGLNPRKQRGGTNEDVARRTALLIDIDRHHGDEGATEKELMDAENDVLRVVSYLEQRGHPEPYVDMSGNGYHIIPIIDLPVDATTTDRIKEFYKSLPAETDPKNADLARLCKVTGTMSLRGTPRLSYLVSPGEWEKDKILEAYLTTEAQKLDGSAPAIKPTLNEEEANGWPDAQTRAYFNKMRPCIRLMLRNMNPGAQSKTGHLDHEAHLLIVKDAQYHGVGYNGIISLFSTQPDYKRSITEKLVAAAVTDNVKMGITPWYCANLIKRGWCTTENQNQCTYQVNETGYQAPLTPPTEAAPQPLHSDVILQAVLTKDRKLNDLFLGLANSKYKSLSRAEAALCVKLFMHKFSEAEVRALMAQARIGKWNKENDSYRNKMINSCYAFAQKSLEEKEERDAEKAAETEEKTRPSFPIPEPDGEKTGPPQIPQLIPDHRIMRVDSRWELLDKLGFMKIAFTSLESETALKIVDTLKVDPELVEKQLTALSLYLKAINPTPEFLAGLMGVDAQAQLVEIISILVKEDEPIINSILRAGFSAATTDPINLHAEAPTSEGKTYPITTVLGLFPGMVVWPLMGLSPTALEHDHGVLVDLETGEPLTPKLRAIYAKLDELDPKDKAGNRRLEDEITELKSKGAILINLDGVVLNFLDKPHPETLMRLQPLLSHDRYESWYKYTDPGLRTVTVVLRGWPAVVVATTRGDRGDKDAWDQIASRFITISPRQDPLKYRAAVELIALRKGLPQPMLDRKLGAAKFEWARETIRSICIKLNEFKEEARDKSRTPQANMFWMPFYRHVGKDFPASVGRHMRDSTRFMSSLQMGAAINVYARPTLIIGDFKSIIVARQDYDRAVMEFFEGESAGTIFTGLPAHVLRVFNEIVIPLWRESKVNVKTEGEKDKQTKLAETETESFYPGLPTRQMVDACIKKLEKPLSSNTLRTHYLQPLMNAGLMDMSPHPNDKRMNLYRVLREEINTPFKHRFQDGGIFTLEKLKEAFDELNEICAQECEIRIEDYDSSPLTLEELHERYFAYDEMQIGAHISINEETKGNDERGEKITPKEKRAETGVKTPELPQPLKGPRESADGFGGDNDEGEAGAPPPFKNDVLEALPTSRQKNEIQNREKKEEGKGGASSASSASPSPLTVPVNSETTKVEVPEEEKPVQPMSEPTPVSNEVEVKEVAPDASGATHQPNLNEDVKRVAEVLQSLKFDGGSVNMVSEKAGLPLEDTMRILGEVAKEGHAFRAPGGKWRWQS